MLQESIEIQDLPDLNDPLFIAGFEGWGNALDLSRGMIDYMIRKLDARPFAKLNPDPFYRFDENRPIVEIQDGELLRIVPPGGLFYAAKKGEIGRDIILLRATEPNLGWNRFTDAILSLCQRLGARTVVSLGSMFDNVLHTDTIVSAIASSDQLLGRLKEQKVVAVNYRGPSAIHSTILVEAKNRGFESFSLWCHCPYYLQGTTHFGLLSYLGSLLASCGGFSLDTEELDTTWKDLSKQIQGIIDRNPELQSMINDLRKAKVRGSWEMAKKGDKVIHLEDFLKPK